MKKIFSIILATVLVCVSLLAAIPSASAAKDNEWIMGPDAAYVKHDSKTYYPIPDLPYYIYEIIDYYDGYREVRLEGETEEITKEFFPQTWVRYSVNDDLPWIEVHFPSSSYSSCTILYVEENYLDEYTAFFNGTASNYFCTSNFNDIYYYSDNIKQGFSLTPMDVEKWMSGEAVTTKSFKLGAFEYGEIYGIDKTGTLSAICGVFYIDDDSKDVFLRPASSIITNDNYITETEMYSDVTVYRLEDEKLREELIEYFYTEPEDDLEWLEPEEDDMTFGIAFAVFLFGIIPAAVLVFSIAMLFVVKDKRRYSPAYITMIVGSAIVLVACIILIICLI